MEVETVGAPPPVPPPVRVLDDSFVSFWDIVGRQFMRNRTAVFALRSLQVLVVLAIFAPLIALNIPYVISDAGSVKFPIFIHLFDGHVFDSGVDMFFNLVMVLVPFWWLTAGLVRNLEQGRSRKALAYGVPLAIITLFYASLAIHYWRLGAEDEAWQGPARVVYIKLLGAAFLGILVMLATRFRSRRLSERERRRKFARMRMILLALVGVTLYLIAVGAEFEGEAGKFLNPVTRKWSYTSSVPIYRKKIAKLRKDDTGWAICPPIFFHPTNSNDDSEVALANRLHKPSWSNDTYLGCDINGRDVLTRLLYGTRISLTIGIVAVSIYVSIGIFMGSLAGYFGGRVDMLIMFALQVLMCIPTMFLLLTIIALFDSRSIFIIMVAIGVTGWTGVARLVRGEFFRQRSIDYVAAAKALGVPERKIIFNHILKNSIGPVLVSAAFGVAGAVLTESFLAFLGLGDTTAPSWGQVLRAGQDTRKAWLLYSPGLAIFYLVTVLNIIGEGLRDALDPKLRT